MNTSAKSKQFKEFDEYECGGNGPRPPVPGEESCFSKMTSEDASTSSSAPLNQSPTHATATTTAATPNSIAKWQEQLVYLLADKQGVELLFAFVKIEAGGEDKVEQSIDYIRLKFYFSCEGLKQSNEENVKKLIPIIYRKYVRSLRDTISNELLKTIRISAEDIKNGDATPDKNIFDELQRNVEKTINSSLYPRFLQSDVFLQYVEQIRIEQQSQNQNTGGSGRISHPTCSNSSISGLNTGGIINTSNISSNTIYNQPTVTLPSPLPLPVSSNLQTLHEDSELTLNDDSSSRLLNERSMPKLTKDLLLATQKGRLEVRRQGAHGYNNISFHSSFNPVSRQNSERQSCSSASLTDSEVNSKDGKPYFHRKPTAAEDYRRAHVNPPIESQKTMVKTLPHGQESVGQISKSRLEQASQVLDPEVLTSKLCALKKEMERKEQFDKQYKESERKAQFDKALNDRLKSTQFPSHPKVFPETLLKHGLFEDDDQSILDQHVSRVFSPHLSGEASPIQPRQVSRYHHRPNELSTSLTDFGAQAMRHSKSIPEHASTSMAATTTKKLGNKWPSTYIDSEISDLPYNKIKDMRSTEQLTEESVRKSSSKDDARRMRKLPLPPLPSHQSVSTSSSHHTNSLPRMHESLDEYTYVMYKFSDVSDDIPYRTKIPGKRLTLKHFKEYSPKKGNFRYFFTTHCDDPENPVIQEELVNDADLLPLYDGKVVGSLKHI